MKNFWRLESKKVFKRIKTYLT